MSASTSYPEFSLDDVYTGEPREKTAGWKLCVGLIIAFIVFFVIYLSLPGEMQSVVGGVLDSVFAFVNLLFFSFIVFYLVYVFYSDSRKKSETPDS
jgi:hypothetical protein